MQGPFKAGFRLLLGALAVAAFLSAAPSEAREAIHVDHGVILDPGCDLSLAPAEALRLATLERSFKKSLYEGCFYKVFKFPVGSVGLKEPTLIWGDNRLPQRAVLLNGGIPKEPRLTVEAGVSRVYLDNIGPGDFLVLRFHAGTYLTSNVYRKNPAVIVERDEASTTLMNMSMVKGLCYAAILMNIITFISLLRSNRIYRFYILYAASILLFVESINGIIPEIMGFHHYWNYFPWWQVAIQISGALAQIFVTIYVESYMAFKAKRRAIPWVFRTFYALATLQILLLFVDVNASHNLSNLTILFGAMVLNAVSYYFSFVEKRMSRLIFVGFLFPTLTSSLFVLSLLGVFSLGLYPYVLYLTGSSIETVFFAVGTMMGFNDSFTASLKAKTHLLSQLRKIVYPHQLKMMSEGTELEATMPTVSAEACVISFDIVGSSKIQHEKAKEFFRSVFLRCNEMMMGGYDGESLKADAYRIKEMGDGFLCSVGYPFRSKTGYMAKDAIELSIKFHEVFREEVERLGYREPIHCGIGIALDHITGFYPESGTKEYDLYGKAIILATRYEGMRKILFREGTGGSYLIVQERVYMSLREEEARNFTTVNLEEAGIVVRDDPSAKRLHYMELSTASERADFMRKKIS